MAKKNNVQPASTSVETVQGFYDSLSESITNTSIQAQELITKSVLDNEGKRQALEANQATETLANDELTKLNSILDELKSGTLTSEVEAERVVNAEGIVELANSYVAKMLSDAQTVTAGLIADANLAPEEVGTPVTTPTTETVVSGNEAKPEVAAPTIEDIEKVTSETVPGKEVADTIVNNRNYEDSLDTTLDGPEVVDRNTDDAVVVDVEEALAADNSLEEKLDTLRKFGKQQIKAVLARLDSYNKNMSLDQIVDAKRGANYNYDLYVMLNKNLSKPYSEAKPVLDIITAYFTTYAKGAYKEEALMRFDQEWQYGDQQLKEFKEIVMVLCILSDASQRDKTRKRVSVRTCSFDIEIKNNFQRYFELDN